MAVTEAAAVEAAVLPSAGGPLTVHRAAQQAVHQVVVVVPVGADDVVAWIKMDYVVNGFVGLRCPSTNGWMSYP